MTVGERGGSHAEETRELIVETGLVAEIVLCVNCVQLTETATLLAGVLWKLALVGRRVSGG